MKSGSIEQLARGYLCALVLRFPTFYDLHEISPTVSLLRNREFSSILYLSDSLYPKLNHFEANNLCRFAMNTLAWSRVVGKNLSGTMIEDDSCSALPPSPS